MHLLVHYLIIALPFVSFAGSLMLVKYALENALLVGMLDAIRRTSR